MLVFYKTFAEPKILQQSPIESTHALALSLHTHSHAHARWRDHAPRPGAHRHPPGCGVSRLAHTTRTRHRALACAHPTRPHDTRGTCAHPKTPEIVHRRRSCRDIIPVRHTRGNAWRSALHHAAASQAGAIQEPHPTRGGQQSLIHQSSRCSCACSSSRSCSPCASAPRYASIHSSSCISVRISAPGSILTPGP